MELEPTSTPRKKDICSVLAIKSASFAAGENEVTLL
jgi:hypothetical protein